MIKKIVFVVFISAVILLIDSLLMAHEPGGNRFQMLGMSVRDIITLEPGLKDKNTVYHILGIKEGTNLSFIDDIVQNGNQAVKITHIAGYAPGSTSAVGVNLPEDYYGDIGVEFYFYIKDDLRFDTGTNNSRIRYNNIAYFIQKENGRNIYEQAVKLKQAVVGGPFTLSLNLWDNAGNRYWVHGTTQLPINEWIKVRFEVYSDSQYGGARLYINDIFETEILDIATDNFRKDYFNAGSCARPKYENGTIYFDNIFIFPLP